MDLYASVLRLDRKAYKALKITDNYSLHRVVYSLFDDVRDENQKQASVSSGIQWVDKGGNAFERQILMLSDRKPKSAVNDEYGEVQTKTLPINFLDYQYYRFEVVINPVRRDNKSKKLLPVKGNQEIATWFVETAQRAWGFSVNPAQLQIDKISVVQFNDKNQQKITLQQAKMSGYLAVTDREKFKTSVAKGIGKARTFGCGLLQIVPVIESPFFE